MNARRRRTHRTRTKATVFLTSRDLDVLTFVGINTYASAEQVARELFPSPDRARRRLRQLFDAGYLDVVLASSTLPNLVRLTRDGIAALRERLPEIAERVRLPGPFAIAGVAHHLAIVDMRTYAAALAASEGGQLVMWSNAGGPLHQALRLREKFSLVPDGVFEISMVNKAANAAKADTVRIALEVDRATEVHEVITAKVAKYADVFDTNDTGEPVLDEVWLLVTADVLPGRQDQLRRAVVSAGLGEVARVFDHAHVVRRPVAAPPPRVGGAGRGATRAHGPR